MQLFGFSKAFGKGLEEMHASDSDNKAKESDRNSPDRSFVSRY